MIPRILFPNLPHELEVMCIGKTNVQHGFKSNIHRRILLTSRCYQCSRRIGFKFLEIIWVIWSTIVVQTTAQNPDRLRVPRGEGTTEDCQSVLTKRKASKRGPWKCGPRNKKNECPCAIVLISYSLQKEMVVIGIVPDSCQLMLIFLTFYQIINSWTTNWKI